MRAELPRIVVVIGLSVGFIKCKIIAGQRHGYYLYNFCLSASTSLLFWAHCVIILQFCTSVVPGFRFERRDGAMQRTAKWHAGLEP